MDNTWFIQFIDHHVYFCISEASSTIGVLQRVLVSVIITLLNDNERSLNKKWLRPVTNKSKRQLVGDQSENTFLPSV